MIEHIEKQWLSAYLDNQLSSAQHLQIQQHLTWCEECGQYFANLQSMQQQLQQLSATPAAIDVRAQTLACLPELAENQSRKPWSWVEYSAAAASIACGLLIGSWLMPSVSNSALEVTVIQALGANPPGALCSIPAYCYLEARP